MTGLLIALFLGLIQGLTEFIPVSSTGHLVIFVQWLEFSSPGHVFEVFIQLGSILAVVVLYRKKILQTITGLPTDKTAQKFTLNLVVATIPALVAGAAAHVLIKSLYTPPVIGATLILGGVLILLLEKRFANGKIESIDDIPLRTAFLIGMFQVLALIPGISRSGATIMGALALGLARPAAAEFSFFLAIPVIGAAVLFDVISNWQIITHAGEWGIMLAGFTVAFLSALVVLKLAMRLIARYGFAPFAYYRIAAGLLVLAVAASS